MTVHTENLGKRYNREWIFRNFTYSFQPGVYAVTGPNGSGKSTLLQVLWGQLPSSLGEVKYASASGPVATEEIFQHLVIVTPYMELIEEFTLLEILRFHFSFKKIRDNKTLEQLPDLFELSHARNKTIKNFSSGMKQKLKLGLAFFSESELLFLDEPTTNLDKDAVAWYDRIFGYLENKAIIIIGSNLENEYPSNATKISLLDYK